MAKKYVRNNTTIAARYPNKRARPAAQKLPIIEKIITKYMAPLANRFLSVSDQARTSGRLRRCWWCQNIKAQWAVREIPHTRTTQRVIIQVGPRKSSRSWG